MTEQSNSSPEDQISQLIGALNRNTEAQTQALQEQRQTTAAILTLAQQIADQNEINAALLDVIGDDGEEDDIPQTLTLNQRRQ